MAVLSNLEKSGLVSVEHREKLEYYSITEKGRQALKASYKFEHGQDVSVVVTAPANFRPGTLGSVCGIRQFDGQNLYLLEFPDGEAVEIPEDLIDAVGSAS